MAPVRVLLVDDDALVRAGLRLIISSADDIAVVGEAGDGDEAVAAVQQHHPDVVLMDIRMPRVDGITATAKLRALDAPPQVVVLTTFQADEHVVAALRAGASGFLVKDTPPADILAAIRLVAAGDAIISPSVTRTLLAHFAPSGASDRQQAAARKLADLSDRELEVSTAVGDGSSNAEIAVSLFMREATVKAHVPRILTNLEVSNRVQVAILVHDAAQGRTSEFRA
jgi:DNA-binding NarL/FixJ family response regulator